MLLTIVMYLDQCPENTGINVGKLFKRGAKEKSKENKRKSDEKKTFQEELIALQKVQLKNQEEQEKCTNTLIESMIKAQRKMESEEQEKDRKFFMELGKLLFNN